MPEAPKGEGAAISLTRFLRPRATHETLVEFGHFVTATLRNPQLTPSQRAIAIEDRVVSILEHWGKAYLAALILSGTPLETSDLPAILKAFENSIEVTVLLATASQFNLLAPSVTPLKLKEGWRGVFDQVRIDWYEPACVAPAISKVE
jgi:hypothetical protein